MRFQIRNKLDYSDSIAFESDKFWVEMKFYPLSSWKNIWVYRKIAGIVPCIRTPTMQISMHCKKYQVNKN